MISKQPEFHHKLEDAIEGICLAFEEYFAIEADYHMWKLKNGVPDLDDAEFKAKERAVLEDLFEGDDLAAVLKILFEKKVASE